jgi:23S rRNA (guanine2445-N2)-methyltransferase / 23S rRNA (guanine2069-N7)-methyltransferase
MNYSLFVSCPRGLEYLLEEEVKGLGLHVHRVSPQGVFGEANLAVIYTICLWTRLASRVQLILFNGQAHNEQTLYNLCHQFPWQTLFSPDKTLAIEFHGSSAHIRNSMYGAQVIKDAIADHFRKLQGVRPVVDREHPQILLHAYLKFDTLTVSFDLTGYSLHQRGYRLEAGHAPIKENVAAAMLIRAKWPELSAQGYGFHDPFCGSGTVVIEAAMMAAHIAPGLIRDDQSLHHWAAHQPSLWEKLRVHALEQVKPLAVVLQGTDNNSRAITAAKANADRAGVGRLVHFADQPLNACQAQEAKGLMVCNPPYGERMGEATQLIPLYQQLGQVLHSNFQGWQAAFLTTNPMLAKATGLRSGKQYTIYNGPLECKLYCISLVDNQLKGNSCGPLSTGAQMFANRLQKNFTHLQKWAKRNQITCFRVYDADLPEYAFAIDLYNDYAVLQEYAAPASIDAHKAEKRTLEVLQAVPGVLGVSPNHLVVKQRKQQRGTNQYQKFNQTQKTQIVQEGEARFKVNLYDYLDTGLFLDHRLIRLRFAKLPKGTRFLNCFCYTASASVHAALAGVLTTNVDLSNTYLHWAEDNFKLNGIKSAQHQFIQSDCMQWLKVTRDRFDVIFLDPPSFSNSKRMSSTLDVQRDHEALIIAAVKLLNPGGTLFFSTNLRQFKLSPNLQTQFAIKDISEETIDIDFKRNQRIHRCYEIKAIK